MLKLMIILIRKNNIYNSKIFYSFYFKKKNLNYFIFLVIDMNNFIIV